MWFCRDNYYIKMNSSAMKSRQKIRLILNYKRFISKTSLPASGSFSLSLTFLRTVIHSLLSLGQFMEESILMIFLPQFWLQP